MRQASACSGAAVAGAVVGHDALDADAVGAVVSDGAAQKRGSGDGLLVCEHFDVGQAGGVVDADVDVLPADPACCVVLPVAVDAVTGAGRSAPSFLTSMCTSSPGRLRSYRFAGSGGSSRERLPSPIRASTAETVESGIARHCAISAAVIRRRRSAAIAATRASAVRCGIRCGAEERSSSPCSASRR